MIDNSDNQAVEQPEVHHGSLSDPGTTAHTGLLRRMAKGKEKLVHPPSITVVFLFSRLLKFFINVQSRSLGTSTL